MNTVVLMASPHKSGHTVELASAFLSQLKGNVTIINAFEKKVKPCVDCKYCYDHDECAIKDDMQEILNQIESSDNIVVASPIYFSGFPSPFKAIIDRMQVNFSKKYIRGEKPAMPKKKAVLILTAGAEYKDMFLPCEGIVKQFFNAANAELAGKAFASKTDKVPACENLPALEKAKEIARKLNELNQQ